MAEQKPKQTKQPNKNHQQPKRSRWSWIYYAIMIGLLFFFFNPFGDKKVDKDGKNNESCYVNGS